MRDSLKAPVAYGVAIALGIGLSFTIIQLRNSDDSGCTVEIAEAADRVILGSAKAMQIVSSALDNPATIRIAERQLDEGLPEFKANTAAYSAAKEKCNV